jgi:choline dehydrogenase-like flavoprotein
MSAGDFDAIVVGSGAGGATAALRLTQAGLKVLMLEAGRPYDPVTETPMFNQHIDAPLGNIPTEDRNPRFYDAIIGGIDLADEPYTNAEGSHVKWLRTRMLGGRTNAWWAYVPRYGPYDFQGASRDGYGVDWPVSYDDIAPSYDEIERLMGVYGTTDSYENEPSSPPGILQPPPPLRAYELFAKAGFENLGIPVATTRAAVLTQPKGDRNACFYASHCRRGCSIGAKFQTTTSFLPEALKTGNLTIQTHARVAEVTLGHDGRADGVRYVDTRTGSFGVAKARSVVLAASSYETARLLLASKSDQFPNGLANRSGQVGRNIANTLNFQIRAYFPVLDGRPQYNEDGTSLPHMVVPWFGYKDQAEGRLDFPRGYHIQVFGDRVGAPGIKTGPNIASSEYGYGRELKSSARRRYGSYIDFEMFGEMIPNDDTYMELDPVVVDKWGLAVPRFHWRIGDTERHLIQHAKHTMLDVIERLGGVSAPIEEKDGELGEGATGVHETGAARMGFTGEDSVVNAHSQSWDVDNLVLADGSVFASHAHKNPTLTIMALALRAADALVVRLKSNQI